MLPASIIEPCKNPYNGAQELSNSKGRCSYRSCRTHDARDLGLDFGSVAGFLG